MVGFRDNGWIYKTVGFIVFGLIEIDGYKYR